MRTHTHTHTHKNKLEVLCKDLPPTGSGAPCRRYPSGLELGHTDVLPTHLFHALGLPDLPKAGPSGPTGSLGQGSVFHHLQQLN